VGLAERVDDCCATADVYCVEPQPVPPCDPAVALADIARLGYETPVDDEARLDALSPSPRQRR